MEVTEILQKHVMNEGQRKLLELLKRFDASCRENGITYYLGGGTALGAIRHGGFLPWDDDVDLYITRKEYNKLLAARENIFTDDFILVVAREYKYYGNVLTRMVDTHSTAITKARIVDGTPKGQFLEFFIMDPIPRDPEERQLWLTKHWIYTELLAPTYVVANERIYPWIDEELYRKYRQRYEQEGRDAVLDELEQELFTIPEEEADQYCSAWGLRNLFYDIDWYGTPRYVPFQDTVLPVPSKAENVLRFDYGDSWMYIPEGQDQVTHSLTSSMTIPYKYFTEDYLQYLDPEEVRKIYPPRADAQVEVFFKKMATNKRIQVLKQAAVAASLRYNAKNIDLEKAVEDKDYEGLRSFYTAWYDNQLYAAFWKWTTYLDIGDGHLFYALLPLLMSGDFSKVLKITTWRKNADPLPLSERLDKLVRLADAVRQVYIAIDNKQPEEARRQLAIAKALPFAEDQYDCRYLSIVLDGAETDTPEKAKDVYERATAMEQAYPGKGEILVLMADACYALGDSEKAEELYVRAFEGTRHGIIRMHIQEVLGKIEEAKQ